jgi:hypothetical protein
MVHVTKVRRTPYIVGGGYQRRGEELEEEIVVRGGGRWQGSWQISRKIYGRIYMSRGIYIMLKNINNGSSLESLLINIITSSSQLEPLLIFWTCIRCSSSREPIFMRVLLAVVLN